MWKIANLEPWLKSGAIVCAGLFFVWKLLTGWLFANMSLSVTATREAKDLHTDYLVSSIIMDKGATDSIWLKDVSYRVTGTDPKTTAVICAPESLDGYQRLQTEDNKVKWILDNSTGGELAVSPGEKWQLSAICEVPREKPVRVEVAVFGGRRFWYPGFQWRANTVSLPRPASSSVTPLTADKAQTSGAPPTPVATAPAH